MKLTDLPLQDLLHRLHGSGSIPLSDMPEIDLYMEQLLQFLNGRLHPHRRDTDKTLTKTMINNYTKEGVLTQPVNKKYSRYHIMLLVLVYQLKNIISIHDIRSLFHPVLKDINDLDDDVIPLDLIYSTFLDLEEEQLAELSGHYQEKIKSIASKFNDMDETNRSAVEMFLLVIMLVAQANVSKRLAEKLIEEYFTE